MSSKNLLPLGLLAFGALLWMSVRFYLERTVMFDASFQLFSVVKTGSPAIQCFRFGALCVQVFPLLMLLFHGSLQAVAISYSAGFELFYLGCFLLCLLWLKEHRFALLILLSCTLMVSHTFYWVQCELAQAIVFTLFYFALLLRVLQGSRHQPWYFFLLLPVLITACFYHPSIIFLFLFVSCFLHLDYPQHRRWLGLQLALFAVVYGIKLVFFKTVYDTDSIAMLNNIRHLFPHYFNTGSDKTFLHGLLTDYYFIGLLVVADTVYLWYKKCWKKLLLFLFFFFGYLFVVNISFPFGQFPFYLEAQYQILCIIAAFPFVFEILPLLRRKPYPLLLLTILIGISLIRIYSTHSFYTARLQYRRRLIHRTALLPHQKVILPPTAYPYDTVMLCWGCAYETWLLSTIEERNTRSILMEETPHEFDRFMPGRDALIGKWGLYPYPDCPPAYFHFPDTSAYVRLDSTLKLSP